MKIVKKELEKVHSHMDYYNKIAPFPVYDTEIVSKIKEAVDEIDKNEDIDYDALPVIACKHCKSLNIRIDDFDNDICMRCGEYNQLEEFENIYEYQKVYDKLWKN